MAIASRVSPWLRVVAYILLLVVHVHSRQLLQAATPRPDSPRPPPEKQYGPTNEQGLPWPEVPGQCVFPHPKNGCMCCSTSSCSSRKYEALTIGSAEIAWRGAFQMLMTSAGPRIQGVQAVVTAACNTHTHQHPAAAACSSLLWVRMCRRALYVAECEYVPGREGSTGMCK
jgi:hypothetical protein